MFSPFYQMAGKERSCDCNCVALDVVFRRTSGVGDAGASGGSGRAGGAGHGGAVRDTRDALPRDPLRTPVYLAGLVAAF